MVRNFFTQRYESKQEFQKIKNIIPNLNKFVKFNQIQNATQIIIINLPFQNRKLIYSDTSAT